MRELVMQKIVSDSVLNVLGIVDENSFAVDVDTPEDRPFLQIRWGRNDVGLNKTQVGFRALTIWVHDQPGDYTRIDAIITRLRAILPTLVGESNGVGGYVLALEWSGDSEDLSDDGHRTITRNSSFRLVGSGQ